MNDIESCYWYDWRLGIKDIPLTERLYYGHETCQRLLPSLDIAEKFAKFLSDHSKTNLSLVTPYLTNNGIQKVLKIIDSLQNIYGEIEVICSDWGLLHYLCKHKIGIPVMGRLLAGQITDPRIIRITNCQYKETKTKFIEHINGTRCLLKHKKPSSVLKQHYQSCAIDIKKTISFFSKRGVFRCELNNIGQGIIISSSGFKYSLHIPNVIVSVMRRCPGNGENFNHKSVCFDSKTCSMGNDVNWYYPSFPVNMFRRDNALYYNWSTLPVNLRSLPVDRIVYQKT